MRLVAILILVFSNFAHGETLALEDIQTLWVPSMYANESDSVPFYTLDIKNGMEAIYASLPGQESTTLNCQRKSQNTAHEVFVFHCHLQGKHLITLALSGWVREGGKLRMLYGYEYWLGDPAPGEIHGGVPVSFVPETANQQFKSPAMRAGTSR